MRKSTLSLFYNLHNNLSNSVLKYTRLLTVFLFFTICSNFLQGANKYVKLGGSGAKNGLNWANALDGTGNNIKSIIESASNNDNIFIAGGTYTITSNIYWKTSVNIYGGFSSISPENSLNERLKGVSPSFPWVFPATSTTIINGSSNILGRLLTQSCGISGIVDGITFQNGQSGDNVGGAVYISKGKVVNCIIKNSFSNNGGGIYIGSGAELINSLVFNNTTNASGLKCTYDGGGGVYIDNGGKITNCYVTNNRSFNNGGGIFFNRGGVATNCVISNNYASSGGGAFIEYGGSLINCTVTNNAVPNGTSTRGKGVYYNIYNCTSDVSIKNSVIWNNSGYGNECATNGNAGTISNCAGSFKPAANATCIPLSSSNTTGTNPPKFVNPTSAQGYISNLTPTTIGDWNISDGSALLNKGNDSFNSELFDIIGNTRKYGIIDIGAYELGTVAVLSISITGNVHTYDGNPKSVSVAVNPFNVTNYTVEYKQGINSYTTTKPVNVGVYDVRVTITHPGFSGVQTGTLTINKANITGISFTNTNYEFDNTVKTLAVIGTVPAGVTVTYSNNVKVSAGIYPAVATINGGANYNNSTLNANLEITPKPLIITIVPSSKTYGDVDPIPTYTSNVDVASFGGSISGVLARNVGESVGTYSYSIGSLTAGSNFTISINSCNLAILPKLLSVDVAQVSKPYDGLTSAPMPALNLQQGNGPSQILSSDYSQVSVSATAASFDNKNVGENKIVTVSGIVLSGLKASNYYISNSAKNCTSSIKPVSLFVTGLSVNAKSYDGTNKATLSGFPVLNGLIAGDVVQLVNSTNNQFNTSNAASQIIVSTQFALSGSDAANYSLIQPQLFGDINPVSLYVTFPSISKIYDGNTSITTIPQLTVVGAMNGETIIAGAALAQFDTKQVGSGKTVMLSGIHFTAPVNSNYSLPNSATNNLGIITPRDIQSFCTVSFPAISKVYDGNISVPNISSSSFSVSGLLLGDQVQVLNYTTAAFDNKNVGINKVVTVTSITYSGLDVANYILPKNTNNSNCAITKRSISEDTNIMVTFAPQTKIFDGTTKVLPDSTRTPITIQGLIPGDVVSARATSAFYDNENVGRDKIVTLDGIVYSGIDAANYQLPISATNNQSIISARSITSLPDFKISIANQSKTYDGTTVVKPVAIPEITISGLLPGSVVEAKGSAASYDNKNVGTNKIVTVTNVVYSGKDAGNYILPTVVKNTFSSITKRSVIDEPELAVVFDNQIKRFDGTTNVLPDGANTKIRVLALIENDEVIAKATYAYYSDANVGVNKTVTLNGIIYSGADAGNYNLPQSAINNNCSITPLDILDLPSAKIFIANQTKVYDGTTTLKPNAIPEVYISGLLNGSVVLANGSSASYDNKNVGVNKVVTVRGLVYSGQDAQNYILPDSIRNFTSSITKRTPSNDPSLILSFRDQSKMFDGTTKVLPDSSNTQIVINGLISGDQVVAKASTAAYNDANVGVGKLVILDGINYSGIDASNYNLPSLAINENSVITPYNPNDHSSVRLFIDNQTKIYDGTTDVKPNAIPKVKISGLLPGSELFAVGSSASYDNKNVGENKSVTVNGIVFSGKDAQNYILPTTVVNNSSAIIKRSADLSVSFDAQTKVFDGTTKVLPDSTETTINIAGIIVGDNVTARATSASYDNENVGVNKTVTLNGIVYSGIDAGNYQLPSIIINNESEIKPLSFTQLPDFTMTIANQTKVYDGTTVVKPVAVPAITITGLLKGSVVQATGSSAFYDNKNVGENKVVKVTNINYTGKDAQNYILPTTVQNTSSSITKRSFIDQSDLVVSFNPQTKLFDGNTNVLPDSSATPIYISGLIPGDVVNARANYAAYDNKNVGSNKTVTLDGIIYSGIDANNYELPSTIINNHSSINPLSYTLLPDFRMTIDNQTKVYDGTTFVKPNSIPPITISGLLKGSIVKANGSSAFYDNKNVGENKVVTVLNVEFSGIDAQNYILPTTVVNTASVILKKSVDLVVSFNSQTKVFDGTTKVLPDSTATSINISGLIVGDIVSARATSASYDNENAGINKTVTLDGIVYSGIDAGNYVLPSTVINNSSKITPLSYTMLPHFKMSIADQTKIYDGTITVKPIRIPAITIKGLLPGSVVHALGSAASYDNKNVGTNKVVSVTNVVFSGKDAQNYILPTSVVNTSSNIKKRSVIDDASLVVSFTSQTKVFDGTTKVMPDSTRTPLHIGGLILGDIVLGRATSASYDNENVGTNKTVALNGIIYSGLDAGNYELPLTVVNNQSSITPLSVLKLPNFKMTIDNQSKIYDGTTAVKPNAIPAIAITGLLRGSVVHAQGSAASYDNKNVGINNKVITVTNVQFSGKDAQNYIIPNYVVNSSSSILKRSVADGLTFSFNPQIKVFDGTTKVLPDSTRTPLHIGGIIPGDIVISNITSASYDNENVSSNKTVTLSGIKYSGKDAGNYQLPVSVTNNQSSITPLSVLSLPDFKMTIDNQTKLYDGTTIVKPIAIPAITITGLLKGSVVNATGTSANYDNKNAGYNKVVTVENVIFSGKDANNYIIPNRVVNTSSSITKRSAVDGVALSFEAQSKGYDRTTTVLNTDKVVIVPAITISGILSGDVVTGLGSTAAYDSPSVGFDKAITISGIVYSGSDYINYDLPSTTTSSNHSILPLQLKKLVLQNANISKVYDGTRGIPVLPTVETEGVFPGDELILRYTSALFDDENVGNNKGATLELEASGKDAGNYNFDNRVRLVNCEILPYPVMITPVSGQKRAYEDSEGVLEYQRVTLPASGVALSGHLTRDPGTDPGKYVIRIGDLNQINPNYEVKLDSEIAYYEITTDLYIIMKYGNTLYANNGSDLFVSYQWYKDNALIPNATTQYFRNPDLTLCGEFYCEAIKTNGARVRSYRYVESVGCNGVKKYSIYPTLVDFNGNLRITLDSKNDEYVFENNIDSKIYTVQIYSMSGDVVLEYILDSIEDATVIAPSNSGVYIVKVLQDDSIVLTQKITVK